MNKHLTVVVALTLMLALAGCAPNAPAETRASLDGLRSNMNTDKFTRALEPRTFVFPQDHGPHNDFQLEWWYYTGNLTDVTGRHFGYQLTFFRNALVPPDQQPAVEARSSDLAFTQVYFAHFAITDSGANAHVAFEKWSRGAGGLAGAQSQPFKVNVEDWSAMSSLPGGDATSVRLQAQDGGYSLTLNLTSLKPIVLHGERGLSQKSNARGNASYYYSMTRMATEGTITTPQGAFKVAGNSWLDREWSTSLLDENTEGWDWFSLQFDDDREMMYFKLREKGSDKIVFDKGTFVQADGTSELMSGGSAQINVLATWTSPDSGVTYPAKWRIVAPARQLDVEITPLIPDQEMDLSQRYWEGAVTFKGTLAGKPVAGAGYVELTGYGAQHDAQINAVR